MVAEENPEITRGAEAVDSCSTPSDSSQQIEKEWPNLKPKKYVTVQPIIKPTQRNSRVQRNSNVSRRKMSTRLLAKSPCTKVTRTKRSLPSENLNPKKENETRSKVFMEPPARKSVTAQSFNSQSTRPTRASTLPSSSTLTLKSVSTIKTLTRATHAKTADVMPSLMAPAPTKSLGSRLTPGLSQISLKMSGSTSQLSGSSTITSTGLRLPNVIRATLSSSTKTSKPETSTSVKTLDPSKLKLRSTTREPVTRRSGDKFWKPRVATVTLHPKTPKKVTEIPLKAAEHSPSSEQILLQANNAKSSAKSGTPAEGEKEKKKSKGKKKLSTPTAMASNTPKSENTSRGSKKSEKSKRSKSSKGKGKGKKAKKGKEKVKKLNRKVVYKELKVIEKKMEDEAKNRKKMEWEKHKLYFYWNCVVTRLLDLQRRNHGLKKKEASLKMEKKDGMFHQNWKTMNLSRLQREECLDQKRAEFRSMIRELR